MSVWSSGWETRALEELRAAGHSCVCALHCAFPVDTVFKLYKGANLTAAPVQLLSLFLCEEDCGCASLREHVADLCARPIAEALQPDGWGSRQKWRDRVGLAMGEIAAWLSLPTKCTVPQLDVVGLVSSLVDLSPPVGWVPSGRSDPILIQALEPLWGE